MPPTASALNGVADMTYMAMGNMLPMPFVPFNGVSPSMYNQAFKSSELVTAPPVAAYYLSGSLNKYHTTTAKQISRQHRIFVHKILGACKSAWGTWQDLASLVGLQVMGPTCIGTPACLVGPPLQPLIMLEAPKDTPQELKYSKAIAQAFSTSFSLWQLSVTVPGLPLWPPFAMFPGPIAPPMPNIAPLPLEACVAPGQVAMLAPALVLQMLAALGDPPPQAMWSLQLFTAVAVSLSLNFTQWVATSLWPPGKITGGGPIPTFAPPVAPAGPVVGGQAAAPPGGLTTPGPGGIAAALDKLAMDAVEDMLEGDSMSDITGDMIGDSLDAVFAAVDAKLPGGKGIKNAMKTSTEDAIVKEGEQAAKHEAREVIEGVATKETKAAAEDALESIGLKEAKSEAEKEFDKQLEAKAAKSGKKMLDEEVKKLEKKEVIENAKKASEKATEKEAKKAAEKSAEKKAEEATETAAEKKARAEAVDAAADKVEDRAERATGDVAKKQAKAEAAREAADQADEDAAKAAEKATESKAESALAQKEAKEAEEASEKATDEALDGSAEQMNKEFSEEAADKGKEWVVKDQAEGYGKDVVKDQAKEKSQDALFGDQLSPEDQLVMDRADDEDKQELQKQLDEKKAKKEEESGFLGTKKAANEKLEGFDAALNPWFEKEPEKPEGGASETPEVPGKPGGGKPED